MLYTLLYLSKTSYSLPTVTPKHLQDELIFYFCFRLFATFSMINATPHQLRKGETKFDTCKDLDDVNPLVVTVNPDPLISYNSANFTVSGKLSENYITAAGRNLSWN
ncbi:hypothetical protein RhiirC2_797459 [Rhizophagus irregularis]|uniref:Uncharacterized protein n=1 Tax=Rhizophagus irregularis TaxID=588596 RepID=A0A2N1M808_9GLOM|nr:hypothetical protein RhiirC2_797459 [Rhizophagus irregularis]